MLQVGQHRLGEGVLQVVQDVTNVVLVRLPLRELVPEIKGSVGGINQRMIYARRQLDFRSVLRVAEETNVSLGETMRGF